MVCDSYQGEECRRKNCTYAHEMTSLRRLLQRMGARRKTTAPSLETVRGGCGVMPFCCSRAALSACVRTFVSRTRSCLDANFQFSSETGGKMPQTRARNGVNDLSHQITNSCLSFRIEREIYRPF